MAERVIMVDARSAGYDEFSPADCRSMIGRTYPITNARGARTGDGTITGAGTLDLMRQQLRLTVEVPDVLAGGMDSDEGQMVARAIDRRR